MSLPAARSRAWFTRAAKLIAVLRYPPYRRALRFGVAASTEHARTPLPHDYATVIDVGANRGQFALVARRRFPHAVIVCVEPLDIPRATLERVFPDRARVRVIATAAAESAARARMFVSRADDSSSLLAPTDLQRATFPGTDTVDRIEVPTERLDTLLAGADLARPALLKIDVQGGELGVLAGATGVLDTIDAILVECSFRELYAGQPLADDIVRFAHIHGFALASISSPFVDRAGQVLQADLVFERTG